MLSIRYKLIIPGWTSVFDYMLKSFNNNTNSQYFRDIQNIFDYETNTVNVNIHTISVLKGIIMNASELYQIKNFDYNKVMYASVLSKLRELVDCYEMISDYKNFTTKGVDIK